MKILKFLAIIMISAITTVMTILGLMLWYDLEIVQRSDVEVINANSDSHDEIAVRQVVNHEEEQIEAIDAALEAIVGVISTTNETGGFLGNFSIQQSGTGSGIVYATGDGNTYIVTNEHVINNATNIEVVFNNEEQVRLDAVLVGSDVYTDIAVLRVEGFEADVIAEFGRTEDLRLGQTVIAIGNPLGLDFAGSTTMGVVSGHDRNVSIPIMSTTGYYQNWSMTVLQTDVAINPGNSGGALINLAGEVVGINSMKIIQSMTNGIEGMSFSIPTYVALPIIEDLETYGEVTRPLLGVSLVNLGFVPGNIRMKINLPEDIMTGVFVNEVVSNSMADVMGVEEGDVITHIGDVEVLDSTTFRQALFTYREGDTLTLTIIREGEELEVRTEVVIASEFVQ